MMDFFKSYFAPFAEYDLRLAYSEQELWALLERECVFTQFKIWSWQDLKAQWRAFKAQWCMTGFPVFFMEKKRGEVLLHPIGKGRNYNLYDIQLMIHPDDSTETVLHIVIKQSERPWSLVLFYFFMLSFAVMAWFSGELFIAAISIFVMIPCSFWFLKNIRSKMEKDVPLIQEALERLVMSHHS